MRSAILLVALLGGSSAAQAPAYDWLGDDSSDYFGQAVSGLGDVDGDGVPDIVVGALGDDNGGNYSGAFRIFSGVDGAMIWHVDGDAPSWRLARSVAGPGDLTGDGRAEILVGAANADIHGTDSGVARVYDWSTASILWEFQGDGAHDELGWSVGDAGDVDADGVPDLIAGARQFWGAGGGGIGPGYARVYSGSDGSLLWQFDGDQADDMLGFSVDGAGDVDGDGRADLIVGAPYADAAGGTDSGLARVFSGATGLLLYEYTGAAPGERLGYDVSTAGDVDADGRDDFLIGATDGVVGPIAPGYALLCSGADGAVLQTFTGGNDGDRLGRSVAALGDADGDGWPDVAVGADQDDDNGIGSGTIFVYRGVDGALLWQVTGDEPGDLLGYTVDGARDLNGDGKADLVAGAWNDDTATTTASGEAFVFLSGVPAPAPYCTAKPNSQGCAPSIAATGAASLSVADNFIATASGVLNLKPGLLFWGFGSAAVPFQGGTLCVQPPLKRTGVQFSNGSAPPVNDCSGTFSFAFDQALMAQAGLTAGTQLFAQYWYRDPGFLPPMDTGLTDGLAFEIVP